MLKQLYFEQIQFSVSTVSISKTALFQPIQLSISRQFSSIWPIDRTLSGAIPSGPGVVVIMVENGYSHSSSNPRLGSLHSNVWIQPFSLQQTRLFNFRMATSLEDGKLWRETSRNLLKNWLCVTLYEFIKFGKYIDYILE